MAFLTPIRSGFPMTSRSAFPDTERAESQSKKMSQPMSAAAFLRRCDVANEPMVGFSPSLMEPPQKILLRTNHRWIFVYFCGVLWMDVNVRPRFFAKNGRRNYMKVHELLIWSMDILRESCHEATNVICI